MSDVQHFSEFLGTQEQRNSQAPTQGADPSSSHAPFVNYRTLTSQLAETWNAYTAQGYPSHVSSRWDCTSRPNVPRWPNPPVSWDYLNILNILRYDTPEPADLSTPKPVREVILELKAHPTPQWRRDQAQLLRERLDEIAHEFGLLTARDVDALGGHPSSNPSANPSRWKRNHKVVAIETRTGDLYPGFQFNVVTGQPLPSIKPALEAWGVSDPVGFTIWCTAPNEWLDGQRPVDCLSDIDRVVAATTAAGE